MGTPKELGTLRSLGRDRLCDEVVFRLMIDLGDLYGGKAIES